MNISTYFNYMISPSKIESLLSENRELSVINKSKDKILANISHEIRNPISSIIGISSILKDYFTDKRIDQECLEYLQLIEESSQETLKFTEDLLDVSQLSSGTFDIDLSDKIDLSDLIKRVANTSQHIYMKNHVNIRSSVDKLLPKIHLDKRRTKQILVNLISNAVKYSKEFVNIDIAAKFLETTNKVMITISDNGLGMTEEEIKIALQEFKTVQSNKTKKVDSFGLGLPLVKYLVENQGGEIEIKSQKDVGTSVLIYFKV